ncbi:hypothetical protein [Shouchella shacheensis]|uniref:hypothetical protein n=1 Tax=Shouchella shacheensis TaxID=1649580 RepID=UPI00073FFF84|nr:hypothetical protein [Shouchella shacheensis]
MKRRDWMIASVLIILGLHCLVMSGMISASADVPSYLHLLLRICFWMGVPLFVGAIIYVLFLQMKKRKGRHS